MPLLAYLSFFRFPSPWSWGMTPALSTLRFVSWNVGGLGNATKLEQVMAHLNQLKGNIYFIQETHMLNREVACLKRNWVGGIYHTSFNSKTSGAAILIWKGVGFILNSSVLDPGGRFVMISGALWNTRYLLVCMYGPNWDDHHFFTKLSASFPDVHNSQIILGGDFNLVQDPQLDRLASRSVLPSRPSNALSNLSHEYSLTDLWRQKFPGSRGFSFFLHVHHTYSHIDFFLLDVWLLLKVIASDYHSIAISDHTPTSLDLAVSTQPGLLRLWRFNVLLLAEECYRQFGQAQISLYLELNDLTGTGRGVLWE